MSKTDIVKIQQNKNYPNLLDVYTKNENGDGSSYSIDKDSVIKLNDFILSQENDKKEEQNG